MGSIFFFLSWRLTSSLSLIQKGTISITTFIVFFLLWSPTSVSFLHLFSSPLIVTIIITCNSFFFLQRHPKCCLFSSSLPPSDVFLALCVCAATLFLGHHHLHLLLDSTISSSSPCSVAVKVAVLMSLLS